MTADRPTSRSEPAEGRRLRRMPPERLSDEQRALYATIAGGPRGSGPQHFALTGDDGALNGPFEAMLLSPVVGTAVQELGAAVRYGSGLPDRLREMAILLVAAYWRSAFELMAHTALGRATGLGDDDLKTLADGRTPPSADDDETVACAVVRALLDDGNLAHDEYVAAAAQLGEATVFELTTLVGYYSMLALQLRVFGVDT